MRCLFLFVVLLVAACSTPYPEQPSNQDTVYPKGMGLALKASIDECDHRHKLGELQSWTARAKCINDRVEEIVRKYNFAYMDGIRLMAATRLDVSKRLDSGTITEDQAKIEYRQISDQVVAEYRRRDRLREQGSPDWNSTVCRIVGDLLECTKS